MTDSSEGVITNCDWIAPFSLPLQTEIPDASPKFHPFKKIAGFR